MLKSSAFAKVTSHPYGSRPFPLLVQSWSDGKTLAQSKCMILNMQGNSSCAPPHLGRCSAYIALKYVIAIEVGKRSEDK